MVRSSATALAYFRKLYKSPTQLYCWSCVFHEFYEDSTQLFGCLAMSPLIRKGLHATLQLVRGVFEDRRWTLGTLLAIV